ncbi:MAG: hypothetical protein A3I75_00515 [Deltaproteobacteria bacterium RIFCSPLOWO2_02_FULL_50_16]|nr:MAG: hypothetical protein A2053_06355 [Deltaproteobacteria bacterium GWA2_50_8]OGQ31879.1 MAG: hypothetical protein A3B79_07535 [Deltaproteobacteria bacterium RIFCSPHIGHO2_02_FULL_50_15]OGQ55426.1 MAG: hypothetical protein A3I75_00515 [Deltaproteobacteria bacterium RIFCSPLOWO2_02_FULL_50_16]OGQ66764.1 MAG: hypothetical protein A3F89_07055 [Deltaproteobacteria bacterium RIFCSPLOWO2_12_FULL_50_11]
MDSIFYWKLFNFAVFLTILIVLLRRPLRDFWKIRANEIGFHIEESMKLRREAEEGLSHCQAKMNQIEQETRTLIASLSDEGNLEKQHLKKRAEIFIERLKEDSKRQVEQEVRKTKELIKKEMARLTIEYAEKAIVEKMTPQDQKRLMDDYLKQLQEQKDTVQGGLS